MHYILAIDQGTTSTRSIIYDEAMTPIHSHQQEFQQIFPHSGWVEHDPEEIWQSVLATIKGALAKARLAVGEIAAIGITNQRETTLVWDRETGVPIYNAIVWQDRRTGDFTETLKAAGHEAMISAQTGLLADPYFSATKVKWILDHVADARARAQRGELAVGTIDSFIIWRLTKGAAHVTDATNAARTMLYDIHRGRWSDDICALLDIPMAMLPTVKNCADDFGVTDPDLLGAVIPISGVAGDQQAATIGQAAFTPGTIKSTYGTGSFVLLNTGDTAVISQNRMLTTIAYQLGGRVTYALEGSIFVAGAAVQWLRDGLKIVANAADTQAMAEAARDDEGLILVPAFTGLGAPYWRPEVRGAIFGLSRGTGPNELARATLRSVGYQTRDLIDAMQADWTGGAITSLRIDGGLSASTYAMQFASDILGLPLERPANLETTALGAAWLAGMQSGLYPDQAGFAAMRAVDHRFTPQIDAATREAMLAPWRDAIGRLLVDVGGLR